MTDPSTNERSLLDLTSVLSDEKVETLRAALDERREHRQRDLDDIADRMGDADESY